VTHAALMSLLVLTGCHLPHPPKGPRVGYDHNGISRPEAKWISYS
jgi:hypothetical protein